MTQEEILQYNQRCAEFLGWNKTSEQFKIDWIGCKTKERLDKINRDYIPILEKDGDVIFPDFAVMDYVNNWNWIMEVVEAIIKIPNNSSAGDTTLQTHKKDVQYTLMSTKKEAVVKAINQFLIWYEQK